MKNISYLCFLLLSLAGCSSIAEEGASGTDHSVNHVIVVGVDGMSPDGINNASTPNMDHLMENGAYTMNARAVLPTSSSSNWASMIMGAGPEQHGITSNDWERDDHILPPVTLGSEEIFPSIFTLIREQLPDAEMGAIYHWGGFGRLYEKSMVNLDVSPDDERATATEAVRYLKDKKPNFLFVHIDHVDGAGHGKGHGSPEYYEAVALADSLIGLIFEATKEAGISDDMLFVVSSDHGGIGYGHGGESLSEIEIPFILFGPKIKAGKEIAHEVYQYDNAATVAFAFGLKQPYAWIGKPVKSAFKGFPNLVSKGQLKMLATPKFVPGRIGDAPPGGLFIGETAEAKIETREPNSTIYFTLDSTDPDKYAKQYQSPITIDKSTIVKAKVINEAGEKSLTETAYFRIANPDENNGIKWSYYEGENWTYLPVFESLTPKNTGTTYEFRIGDINERKGQFGIVFESFIKIDEEGDYKFYTNSDDGSKLFINGKQVVDNDGSHGNIERSGEVKLEPGLHKIKVLYFNEYGGLWLDVYYRGPGITKQIIPPDVLFLENDVI